MMTDQLYDSYLTFLESLRQGLEALTALADEKIRAVENDDLMALDEVLRREQAQALVFRGLDQSRDKLLGDMGLQGVSLSQVPQRFPAGSQERVRQAVTALQSQYQTYQKRAGEARSILEKNLREIEGTISSMGGGPGLSGPGYSGPGAQIPKSMKTDFRA